MSAADDPRILEAKSIPVPELVNRLGIANLRPIAGELIGPCPMCGGRDRFGINISSRAFLCRKCDLRGGDQIALVMQVLGMKFYERDEATGARCYPPLDWLFGVGSAQADPAEIERRRARAAESDRKQREATERYRAKAIADAKSIWTRSRPGSMGVVRAYLLARGMTAKMLPDIPGALRFVLDHAYVKKVGTEFITMHRGPCMIAGVLDPQGNLTCVHQTWVDSTPPHGKARIFHNGEAQNAKLVRGSKKGGAIRLHTPQNADTLVMGEGIETTLSAMVATPFEGAAYWAGVDLGNMSGKMQRVPGTRHSGMPDMSDAEAFVPPPWVKRLVFLMDGDSDEKPTRAKLECGLRRAMAHRPELRAQIVQAGDGVDFNDLLMATKDGAPS